jgi:hypothetical protein
MLLRTLADRDEWRDAHREWLAFRDFSLKYLPGGDERVSAWQVRILNHRQTAANWHARAVAGTGRPTTLAAIHGRTPPHPPRHRPSTATPTVREQLHAAYLAALGD